MFRCLLLNYPRAALGELWRRPRGQIPALDALRTFAVLFVVAGNFTHNYLNLGGTENFFSRLPFVRGGWIGVDLFFVLSGYFIGKQLWRELLQTQTLNVRQFILRRGLRIWPLYFFFLVFVIAVLGRGSFPFGRWWSDAVFLTNYVNQGVVMGSWSLCTEEQFYILAPLLLLLGMRRSGPIARYRKYLWALLVLLPTLRAATWWWFTGGLTNHEPALFIRVLYEPIHTHSDGLVMGLLLANFEATEGERTTRGFFTSGWCVAAALAACVGLSYVQREVFDFTGITLVFGAFTWFLLARPAARWLAPLRVWPFYLLSRLSYGMYLNHEYMHEWLANLALKYVPLADRAPAVNNIAAVVMLILLSAAAAVFTFCAVEYPFLRLRDHLLSRNRRNTRNVNRADIASAAGGNNREKPYTVSSPPLRLYERAGDPPNMQNGNTDCQAGNDQTPPCPIPDVNTYGAEVRAKQASPNG